MIKHFRTVLLTCVAAGTLAPGASWAQDAEAQGEAPAAADAAPDSDIVITGTRLVSNGNQAPTPVTVVSADTLTAATPSSIPDALNKLPQFTLSTGPGRVSPGVTSLTNVGNYLNLRGVGIGRGLILFDGRRVPATTDTGFIDTNTLPQLLVQRVDVVTAGASAAYGSDAVSGVVNFVLDRKFTGVRGLAQAGISEEGDGANWRVGLAAGTRFADDRGHILVSAEHFESNAILRSSRPLMNRYFARGGSGTVAAPTFTAEGTGFLGYTAGGVVLGAGPLAGYQFTPSGLAAFNAGTNIGGGLCTGCDGGRFDTATDLTPNVDNTQLYGRVSFEVSPAFKPFVDVSWARSANVSDNINTFLPSVTIFSGNAFLPANAQSLLTAGNAASFRIGRLNLEMPFYQGDVMSKGFNVTAGAEGSLGGGWSYDAYYTHGEGRLDVIARNVLDNQRFFAAVDAVSDGNGNIVCRVAITNPGQYPGCVPINLFGSGSPSAQAIDYVLGESRFNTKNVLDVAAANLSGSLFDLPAGAVSVAMGVEYRRQSLVQTSNANPATPPAFTGIRGVSPGTLRFSNTNGGVADGSVEVKEAYGEISVPLLRDQPFAHSLDLNGAIRVTDYSTSGTVTTWKVGATWEPVQGVRFRGTRSRDIRAPNLIELFAGLRQSQNTFNDIHTGGAGSIFIQQAGNPDLDPEIGETTTFGVVLQPSFLPRFSLAVDYYELRISDAITTQTPLQINQACEDSGGTSPLCSLIQRPGPFSDRSVGNYPIAILQIPFNAASVITRGVDIDASQRFTLGSGDLTVRLIGNYLAEYRTRLSAAGAQINETGILGRPRWSLTGMLDYRAGPFAIAYQGRYSSGVVQDRQFVYRASDLRVPSYFISDLTLSFDIARQGGKGTFFLTVNNLFDRDPPIVPQDQLPGFNYPTFQPAYDAIGRTYTAGIRFKF